MLECVCGDVWAHAACPKQCESNECTQNMVLVRVTYKEKNGLFSFLLLSSLLRILPRGYTHTLHSSGLYYNPCDKMWVVFVYKKKEREGFQLDSVGYSYTIYFLQSVSIGRNFMPFL